MTNTPHVPGETLSELLDGFLSEAEARNAGAHVSECDRCRTLFQELQSVAAAGRSLLDKDPPAEIWTAVFAATIGGGVVPRGLRPRFLSGFSGVAAASLIVGIFLGSAIPQLLDSRRVPAPDATIASPASFVSITSPSSLERPVASVYVRATQDQLVLIQARRADQFRVLQQAKDSLSRLAHEIDSLRTLYIKTTSTDDWIPLEQAYVRRLTFVSRLSATVAR